MIAAENHGHEVVRSPGSLKNMGSLNIFFIGCVVVGTLAFLIGLKVDSSRTWASFVQNHFYFLSLAIGGLFFASLQWLTGAMWSAPIRRISESFTAYLPVALVLFFVLYFGFHDLYPWTHVDHVKGDPILEGKASYLNVGFFIIRNVMAFGLWIFFAKKMVGNSIAQDSSRDPELTARNRTLSPGFLIVFALTFTMSAFDHLMSLDPHWFSTMFGVYCFAGLFYSTLALLTVITIWLTDAGYLKGIVNDNHLHDLGKFLFAFTVFWAYIGFSQYMLIWYANLPEETGFFLRRLDGGWKYVSLFLLIGKFMTPFFLLLPRDAKRNSGLLKVVACFMLFAQWIDMLWLVQPEFSPRGPVLGWIEIGVPFAFIGLFGWVIIRFLSRHSVVAIGDPKLAHSVFHHHQ